MIQPPRYIYNLNENCKKSMIKAMTTKKIIILKYEVQAVKSNFIKPILMLNKKMFGVQMSLFCICQFLRQLLWCELGAGKGGSEEWGGWLFLRDRIRYRV